MDVDARFLLANERTLLAWVRTSLTLLAAGVGTLQLIEPRRWAERPLHQKAQQQATKVAHHFF